MSILENSAAKVESAVDSPQSWLPALLFAIALTGNGALHLFATHYIPAAEANLISYLWPIEIVVVAAALDLFKLRAVQVIGLALGFIGAGILMGGLTLGGPACRSRWAEQSWVPLFDAARLASTGRAESPR
jgi:drug/metabolite transporter (DMT)-like permease